MPKKAFELRQEAAALRGMAELPANAPIRDRMLALADKYEELAAERERLGLRPEERGADD